MTEKKFNFLSFGYGIGIGIINTAIFNPVDKALYMSVITKSKLFTKANWKSPYSGIKEAFAGRIISYGMYFPTIDMWKYICNKIENDKQKLLLASTLTGTTIACISNPLTVAKMHKWNNPTIDHRTSLCKSALNMTKQFGVGVFARGVQYTIPRDIIFSVVYIMLNDRINKDNSFVLNAGSAMVATTLASPINYIRSIALAEPLTNSSICVKQIIKNLIEEIKHKPNKLRYVCCDKFLIGWGTLRVAIGMAFTHVLYLYFSEQR